MKIILELILLSSISISLLFTGCNSCAKLQETANPEASCEEIFNKSKQLAMCANNLFPQCTPCKEAPKILEASKNTVGRLQSISKSSSELSKDKSIPKKDSKNPSDAEQVFKDIIAKQEQEKAELARKRAEKIQETKKKEEAEKLLAEQIKSKKGSAYKYLDFGESLSSVEAKLQAVNQKFKIQKNDNGHCISMLDNDKAVTLNILPKTGLYLYTVIFPDNNDIKTAIINKYSTKYGKPETGKYCSDGEYRLSALLPFKIPNCRFRMIRENLLWKGKVESVVMISPEVKKIISIIDNSLDKNSNYPNGMKDKLLQVANQLEKDFPNNTEIPRKALLGFFEADMLVPVYGEEPSLEEKGFATADSKLQEQLFKKCIGENVIILSIGTQKLKDKVKTELTAIKKHKADIAIAKAEAEKKAKEKAINENLNF